MRLRSAALAAVLALAAPAASAQLTIPQRASDEVRASPNALVGQTVGTTDMAITYGRPSVRGRVIFGDLVPYGEVWRTGANEATTFSTSRDVTVEGQPLPAGTYALVTIPTEGAWTVAFNGAFEQWGAFEYDESLDVLRVEVTPEEAPATEMMTFAFENVTDTSADVVLSWAGLRVPFHVEVEPGPAPEPED
jgi:hypothetical protein